MKQVIELEYPVSDGGEVVERLSMRRPKVRDQLGSENNSGDTDAQKEVSLLAALCDVPSLVIEDLDMKDYGKVQKAYLSFLE